MKRKLALDPNEIEETPFYGYHAEVDKSYDRIRHPGINWFSCVFGTVRRAASTATLAHVSLR